MQRYKELIKFSVRHCYNSCVYPPPSDRYAEQVIPLLVQAQRKLDQRITKLGGVAPPQPHFRKLMAQFGGVIKAKDYLKAQLRIEINKSNVQQFEPGSQIDPMGHNVHSCE